MKIFRCVLLSLILIAIEPALALRCGGKPGYGYHNGLSQWLTGRYSEQAANESTT